MKYYRGIELHEQDYKIISTIEDALGIKIGFYNFIENPNGYIQSNFFSNQGYIIYLMLTDFKTHVLPPEIMNLKHLENLVLQMPLIDIPVEIFKMEALKCLHIDSSEFFKLPLIQKNSIIEEFSITQSNLVELNSTIGYLGSLKYLNLGDNQIEELPESIGKLNNLTEVHIYGNKLTHLPKSLGNLKLLKRIIASNNNLSELPDSLGNLISLEYLDLYKNTISKLPESILDLKKLKKINIQKNNLSMNNVVIDKLITRGIKVRL